ncbi:MAG: adenylate/guanylate cyclase domain-containing protein [Lacunisphaera sp.]|nr:adenylate/guanylate cyclase domain-containing protein [Lacunisphaera sp.]
MLLALPLAVQAAFFQRGEGQFLILKNEVEYRRDLAADATITQAMAANEGWIAQSATPFPLTLDPINLWARFDLPVVTVSRQILLDSSPWERVEYYFVRDGQVVDRQLAGTLVPMSARSTHISMTPLFAHAGFVAVELTPQSRITVFARLASAQRFMPITRLRFYLWDTEQVLTGERRERLFQGVYLGIILVLVVYNLGLFFAIREPSYLYYVISECGGLLFWSDLVGLTSEFLWSNRPAWEFTSLWIWICLSGWAGGQFIRHYLDTAKHFPRSDTVLKWIALANVPLVPVIFMAPAKAAYQLEALMGAWGVAEIGVWVAVMVLAMQRRHPLARYFLAACLASATGSVIAGGAMLGLIPGTDFTLHAGQVGSSITGIVLSMGLGFRLRRLQTEVADRQLAEARRQGEHERENRELVEAHNRGLEAKVQERTSELVLAQEKSDAMLGNILPRAIIDELKARGETEPRRHEDASILFTDFVGFTQAVSTIPPKRLVQELDEIFRGFDDLTTQHGLEKIKTIGDAYMAAAGLPLSAADHAVRCVRAALALTRFIETRNQTAAMKWGLRVGVHSGAVVAGVVGKNKYAYDVWGDTVNIASRLESASEVNRVNISAYTYELVRAHFVCEYRGKLAAKGKGDIDMYFVQSEKIGEPVRP